MYVGKLLAILYMTLIWESETRLSTRLGNYQRLHLLPHRTIGDYRPISLTNIHLVQSCALVGLLGRCTFAAIGLSMTIGLGRQRSEATVR